MIEKITPVRKSILANIRIQRFTPSEHKSAYFDNFKVSVETGMTVLEALRLIKNTQDSSLTFRAFCRSKICGSCAVRVNGKPVLACSTQLMPILEDFKKDSVSIQPLKNMPVLRDLVVDIEPVIEKLSKMHPYLMENRERIPETLEQESIMSKQEHSRFDYITDCILCGSCYSACSAASADPTYAGPLTLGKAYRFSADVRDSFQGERMQAAVDQGLWSCAQCRKCINVCPKDTRPAVSIQRMRKMSIDDGIHDTAGSRRAKAYTGDVAKYGQVNKPMLPVIVNGPKGWAAIEAAENYLKKHGIEPTLQVCTLGGQSSTQKIYDKVKELESKGENKT
ncbi:MAG: succinate dehydrogenase/fumarate reductase iron-sulfur subunit [gamma proteobacterium endosymbiont of Lamellibrachia anaximandri]|nr:succinate dehydrogenase/fumarate reductase iron-sulfur subunit [gamma proteobacterium endosymbiont of Lamellibrachia anaximandri]